MLWKLWISTSLSSIGWSSLGLSILFCLIGINLLVLTLTHSGRNFHRLAYAIGSQIACLRIE